MSGYEGEEDNKAADLGRRGWRRGWRHAEPLLLVALLASVHALLWVGAETALGRALALSSLGLMLLWQPLVAGAVAITPRQLWGAALGAGAVLVWLNGWIVLLWIVLLAALIGGRVVVGPGRLPRIAQLCAFAYLVGALSLIALPALVEPEFAPPAGLRELAFWVLPALWLPLCLPGAGARQRSLGAGIDFIASLIVLLVLATVGLGTLAILSTSRIGYVPGLLIALAGVAAMLVALSLAWQPRGRYRGIGLSMTRYLLSLVLPYERWLAGLAEFARREEDPDRFLIEALDSLRDLPWVAGGHWSLGGGEHRFGRTIGHAQPFSFGDVALVLYTAQPLSPSLLWHFDLMLRLLAEFHAAKRRSLALQQLTYLSAVHETGARLTHDIKNLLQSLTALCFAAERESDPPSPHFRQLMQRQLPQLAQRLQATLDALNRPDTGRDEERSALVWWESLLRRYEGSGIRFSCVDPPDDSPVPVDLLDNVVDNLLRNAQAKRASEAGTGGAGETEVAITVRVRFADGPALSVEDNGRPVPDALARQLFRAPVDSATGFGIGLLQAARYAERRGFVLRLAENRPGRVRFQLEPAHSVRLATAVPASTLPARR